MIKILFLPYISAILPKGTRNIAAARRYEVAIQPSKTAFILNSLPIEGRAILTEEPIKGVRKEVNVATKRAALFIAASSLLMLSIINDFQKKRKRYLPEVCLFDRNLKQGFWVAGL